MSDRQTPESRLHALTDPHASIVGADGSVRPIDTRPIPGWQNHAGGATRGVKEYRGDQHAGVDNSVQAAQGCRVAAGVSDGADLCTLGTADLPVDDQSMLEMLWSRRREVYARTGKLPTEFTLTPDQFCHLRAQVTDSMSYAVFNVVGEFGYMVFAIPVCVVAPTHGR